MSSFLAELQRRNVVKVGAAYLVLAWVMVQVTATAAPAFGMPGWVLTVVIWFGVIGFPFALFFSWAFELTPEGLKRSEDVPAGASVTAQTGSQLNRFILALLVIAVGVVAYQQWLISRAPDVSPAADASAESAAPSAGTRDSIAVLPFVNMSSDPEQEYFSDGIAEELLNALARIRELKVAARTSSFAFKNNQGDVRKIGETLNVDTVLEGSLRKSGKRLRITAQLVDVESGYHLWSETYDRELDDIFAVQDEITAKIVAALKPHLATGEVASVTETRDTAAYDAYLQGRQALNQRSRASIERAQAAFERATARDPGFALAWAGQALAVYLLSESGYGELDWKIATERAVVLLERAMTLDPELPEGFAVRGLIDMHYLRFDQALVNFDRAIATNPGTAEFHLWRANTLNALAYYRMASEALQRAYALDPLHPSVLASRAQRACVYGSEPLDEALFEPLARYPHQDAIIRTHCLQQRGEYAAAYRFIGANAGNAGADYNEASELVRFTLKDCTDRYTAAFGPAGVGEVYRLLYCGSDAQAEAALQALPPALRAHDLAQEYRSLLQLRRGDHAGLLETLARAYADIEIAPEMGSHPNSWTNLMLNQAFALQHLGRAQEATLILSKVRTFIDRAKQEGATRGYRFLEGRLALLEGDLDGGAALIEQGLRDFETGWVMERDPIVLALLGEARVRALMRFTFEHVNAERAKLGMPPAEF